MVVSAYFALEQSTQYIWGDSGASSVTSGLDLTFNALADGSGRMGTYLDLGSNFAGLLAMGLLIEASVAPSAGNTVQGFLAFSPDTSTWPGKVTGLNAAYPTVVSANARQLGPPNIILAATADAATRLVQAPEPVLPLFRYVAPVVINYLGVGIASHASVASNLSRVTLTVIHNRQQTASAA